MPGTVINIRLASLLCSFPPKHWLFLCLRTRENKHWIIKQYPKVTRLVNKHKDEFTVFCCFFVLLLFHHTASSLSSATCKNSDGFTDLTHLREFSYLLVYLFFKDQYFAHLEFQHAIWGHRETLAWHPFHVSSIHRFRSWFLNLSVILWALVKNILRSFTFHLEIRADRCHCSKNANKQLVNGFHFILSTWLVFLGLFI